MVVVVAVMGLHGDRKGVAVMWGREWRFYTSSIQLKKVPMHSGKPICAPPRPSDVPPTLSLKQFQCSSTCPMVRYPAVMWGRVAILREFNLTEEGIYALGKARLRSTPYIWSANVVYKTAPLFVSLSDGSIFWAL